MSFGVYPLNLNLVELSFSFYAAGDRLSVSLIKRISCPVTYTTLVDGTRFTYCSVFAEELPVELVYSVSSACIMFRWRVKITNVSSLLSCADVE